MENGGGLNHRVAELEQRVAALAYLVGNLTPIVGMMNTVLARLADDTAFETLDVEIYRAKFAELDAELTRLVDEIEKTWPPTDKES